MTGTYLSETVTNRIKRMYEEHQIEIPQSFIALFTDPGRQKPNASREVITERYELCEDLANMLTETARDMLSSLGITEDDVLTQCAQGLTGTGAVVSQPEADWVVRRLAELMDWQFYRLHCDQREGEVLAAR